MYVLSLMNQKGGTGKTTTAIQLCAGFSARGKSVLAIDLDAQANMTSVVLDRDNPAIDASPSIYDVLVGKIAATSAIQPTSLNDSCGIIPASLSDKSLSYIDNALGDDPIERVFRLAEAINSIGDAYDICIIDTPPSRSLISYNALIASNGIVVPVCASEFSISGVVDLGDSLSRARRYASCNPKVLGIVVTQYRANTVVAQSLDKVIGDVAQKLGGRLFKSHIREATAIVESQSVGADIFSYAPKSSVASDYNLLTDELMEVIFDV